MIEAEDSTARQIIEEAESTVSQLTRMVERLNRFTDHLELMTMSMLNPERPGEASGTV